MNKRFLPLTILLLLLLLFSQVMGQEQTQQDNLYTVEAGDTLEDIATEFGLSVETILALNNIKNARAFSVGRTFNLSLDNLVMVKDALVNPLPLPLDSEDEASTNQEVDTVLKDFSSVLKSEAAFESQNASTNFTGELWPEIYPAPISNIMFSTNELKPGQSFSMTIELQEAAALQAHFVGQKFQFLKENDLSHTTLMAVPINQTPGLYPLDLEISFGEDTVQNLVLPIVVSPLSSAGFETENVSAEAINTLPINLQTQHSEANAVFDSCTQFEPVRRWDSAFAKPVSRDITLDFAIKTVFEGSSAQGIHQGLDFVANKGAKIFASANGIVRLAQDFDVQGKTIVLDHGLGVCTVYNYLDGITVTEGQEVAKGDPIGTLGSSGLVKLVHLHWELRVMGIAVDPSIWLETE